MPIITALIGFPIIIAVILSIARSKKAFTYIIRTSASVIIVLSIFFATQNLNRILIINLSEMEWLKYITIAIELLMAGYIVYAAFKNKSYWAALFSAVQIGLMLWFEFTTAKDIVVRQSIYIDKLSLLMLMIVGIIGSLICIYAIEYMKDYHHHHPEVKDRRNVFFAVLFVFISAMFGLVVFNDMSLMLFCWEITSFCSFLLIGYTKTDEAVQNSFTAITINVFGGLLFTIGMLILGINYHVIDFNGLLQLDSHSAPVILAVLLIATAGLTKSAQMPFSKWLLGAMVAPTPTSAMLHSSTMVKAGVYLIIRLSPMLSTNVAGVTVSLVGGFTFFAATILAVTQSDAKKILAYSTISNLGLIVACAGINTPESIWAAIMLIIFHAIAKSLLFLSVGSTEHQLGSRDVEDMDGLYQISTSLTILLIIGIAGMFLAPFGMLISKWAAMKAFIDSGNILLILLVVFGSSVTLFFWTKWMGKLIANAHRTSPTNYMMRIDEKISLYTLAAMVIVVCAIHPAISSSIVIPYIDGSKHINFASPINALDSTIIILMMCMLFIMPLILYPLYKNYKVKPTSVYFSGQNTGDNESFYGSMGEVRQLELRNWYMKKTIHEEKVRLFGFLICTCVLVIGFCSVIGGLFV